MPDVEMRKAIPSHSTSTSEDPWDGPAQEAKLSNDAGAATYRKAYAWVDPDKDADTKAAYKFIHHFVNGPTDVGAASTKGCQSGIAVLNGGRGGSNIPNDDRQGVWNHLAKHLRDAKLEPAPLAAAPSGSVEHRSYEHVARYVSDAIWAIHPEYLQAFVAIIGERRSGHRPSREEIRSRIAGGRERRDLTPTAPSSPSVAVIPIVGPIAPKMESFDDVSGPQGTTVEGLQKALRAAIANPDVSAIVLNVDSPGGSVDLVPELGAEIFAARGTKPIVAVANIWAASAAYWLASAADELVVTPSGEVGSIGVYSAHEDFSVAMAQKGIKTTFVSAGEYKVEGNPFEPLSESARAEMQSKVDAYYAMFVTAVAAARDVSTQTVEDTFGQGRMVMAADAVSRGMADRVETLDQTLARMAEATTEPANRSAFNVIMGRNRQIPEDATPLAKRVMRFEHEVRAIPRGICGPVEVREAGGRVDVFGYAAIFNREYEVTDRLGSYVEVVLNGCFTKTLRDGADVRYLLNHDGLPLARTKSGTLRLDQDDVGLHYEALDLDSSDPDVQRLVPKLKRGDLAESSFTFQAIRQIWNDDYTHRQLAEVNVFDVSTVTWPASPTTSASLRGGDLVRVLAAVDDEEFGELVAEVRSAGGSFRDAARQAVAVITRALEEPGPEARRDGPPTMSIQKARRLNELLKLKHR